MRTILLFSLLTLIGSACNDPDPIPEEIIQDPEVPNTVDRDSWQRPQVLIGLMEEHVKDRTVAVLFAGDGYFTFKLLEAGANVIAIDPDTANIEILSARKNELGYSDERLQIKHSQDGMTGLAAGEADAALIVHGYGRIADPQGFFKQLREGLKAPRPFYLVEWTDRPTPIGPPQDERAPTQKIMEDLMRSGFASVGALGDKLPYQVLLFASDPIDLEEAQ